MARRRLPAPERRRQLLESAAHVFARCGYRGATTAELARAAGVTEPIIYQHFRGKLDLFVTLIDEISHEVIEAWKKSLQDVDDPKRRLEILLRGNPATHERGRDIYRVIFHAMTESGTDRKVKAALRRHVTTIGAFLKEELAALQQSGAVRDDRTAHSLAMMLIDVAIGYGIIRPLNIPRHSTDTGRKQLQKVLHDMLAP